MLKNRIVLTVAIALAASTTAWADVLLIERAEQAQRSALPKNGQSMNQVRAEYGVPEQELAPVAGNKPAHPAITRWRYPGYTVYFENQRVINAVLNSPTPVARNDN
jgi:hypothetical protein